MNKVLLAIAITALNPNSTIGADAPAADWPKADPAAVARWQAMRFGMFIHWGR